MTARFLSELEVQLLDDSTNDGRGAWELTAPLVFWSEVAGQTFIVPKGFVTDFASVPRLPIAFLLTGDSCHAAAALHDWLYTVKPVSRKVADAVLYEAALATGAPRWRCFLVWLGVRLGGAIHWNPTAVEA